MIQVHIKSRHRAADNDGLGRTWCGWSDGLKPEDVYEAARGCWKLDTERAGAEKFMLAVHDGIVRCVIEIDRVVDTTEEGRRAIEGRPVGDGHPFHDRWFGRPAPGPLGQNPVAYVDDTTLPD